MNAPSSRAALCSDGYDIPAAHLRTRHYTLLASLCLGALTVWLGYRAAQDTGAITGHDHAALVWTVLMLALSHQTVIAWFDRPYTVTDEQARELARLFVEVSIPVYNESVEIVDRTLYALTVQTRPPQRVVLVDDGSDVDYSVLRVFWVARFHELGIELVWHRQANAGKRHAQAVAFRAAGDGVMVTLDSDTALTATALEEILKPFVDARVWSVAGVELAANQTANILTRINGLRQVSWQMVQCAALNRVGGIMVNRGTFAAYRAQLVRETVDAYLAETFCGRPVKYSDDSLLTLYALGRGRAVQQSTAFQLSEYPDRLSHALRQWVRWMRGSTIRSIWRARYLRPGSYAWWINLINWWQLVVSTGAYAYVFLVLPVEGRTALSAVAAAVAASYLANARTLLVARTDQDALAQLDTWLLSPLAWAWSLLVLRPVRFYATLTCANNGWGTRSAVEVGEQTGHSAPAAPPLGAPAPVFATVARRPETTLELERVPAVWIPEPAEPQLPAGTAVIPRVPGRRARAGGHRGARRTVSGASLAALAFMVAALAGGLVLAVTDPSSPSLAPPAAASSHGAAAAPSVSSATLAPAPMPGVVRVAAPLATSSPPTAPAASTHPGAPATTAAAPSTPPARTSAPAASSSTSAAPSPSASSAPASSPAPSPSLPSASPSGTAS